MNILNLIRISLEAFYGWQSLHSYIGSVLGTGGEIIDMDAHNKMIFDDDLFTRSRDTFV